MPSSPFVCVDRTWDGVRLPPHEVVRFELSLAHGEVIVQDELGESLMLPELRIAFEAPFFGDPAPAVSNAPRRAHDRLWEHEVIELFIGSDVTAPDPLRPRYVELEFGPHGHALGLSFSERRRRLERFEVDGDTWLRGPRWSGQARVPLARLPAMPWRVGAFAIHGPPGGRRYLTAVQPPRSSPPDFHDVALWRPLRLDG
jgi:hypothetical protein